MSVRGEVAGIPVIKAPRELRTAGRCESLCFLEIVHTVPFRTEFRKSLDEQKGEEEITLRRISVGLAGGLILMLLAGAVNVFAAGGTADSGQDRTGSITINYYDDADGKKGVSGAGFCAVKVAETSDRYDGYPFTSLIPGLTIDETTMASDAALSVKTCLESGKSLVTYELETDQNGLASVSSVEAGVYLLEETAAAEHHRPSEPVLLTVPYMERDGSAWNYDVSAAPKPVRTGDLKITKSVGGNAGDTKKRFRFKVTFGEEGHFSYTSSDGRSGNVSSGGTLELADGESILIRGLLEGTAYSVTEIRANMDGYSTEAANNEGRIVYAEVTDCRFTNTKNSVTTGSGGGSPGSSSGSSKAGTVKTGDDTDAVLPAILLFASGGILAGAGLLYDRRRRHSRKGY